TGHRRKDLHLNRVRGGRRRLLRRRALRRPAWAAPAGRPRDRRHPLLPKSRTRSPISRTRRGRLGSPATVLNTSHTGSLIWALRSLIRALGSLIRALGSLI